MNATQAENLRILIRHMEAKCERVLDMNTIFQEDVGGSKCGTPACALGECTIIPELRDQGMNCWDALAGELRPSEADTEGAGQFFGLDDTSNK